MGPVEGKPAHRLSCESGVYDVPVHRTSESKKLPIMVLLWNSFAVMAVLGLTSAASELMKRVYPAIAPAAKPVMASSYTTTIARKDLKASRDIVFGPLGNLFCWLLSREVVDLEG